MYASSAGEECLPLSLASLVEEDAEEHAPEYGGYLSNHAMHGIVALHALGGTRCNEFECCIDDTV